MKRFRFRLDAVLRVRRIREDAAKAETLLANQALAAAEATTAERDTHYQLTARPTAPMTYDELQRIRFGLDQAAAAVRFAEAQRVVAADTATAARSEWAERHRGVRAIEQLRDRALVAHRVEIRREEDRLADELAVTRHRERIGQQ